MAGKKRYKRESTVYFQPEHSAGARRFPVKLIRYTKDDDCTGGVSAEIQFLSGRVVRCHPDSLYAEQSEPG